MEAYLIIVCFFTMRDLNGSRTEVLPDEGVLLRFEKSGNVGCPCQGRTQRAFGILTGKVLNHCCKSFGANLVLKHTKVTVGLWKGRHQNAGRRVFDDLR